MANPVKSSKTPAKRSRSEANVRSKSSGLTDVKKAKNSSPKNYDSGFRDTFPTKKNVISKNQSSDHLGNRMKEEDEDIDRRRNSYRDDERSERENYIQRQQHSDRDQWGADNRRTYDDQRINDSNLNWQNSRSDSNDDHSMRNDQNNNGNRRATTADEYEADYRNDNRFYGSEFMDDGLRRNQFQDRNRPSENYQETFGNQANGRNERRTSGSDNRSYQSDDHRNGNYRSYDENGMRNDHPNEWHHQRYNGREWMQDPVPQDRERRYENDHRYAFGSGHLAGYDEDANYVGRRDRWGMGDRGENNDRWNDNDDRRYRKNI